MPPKNPQKGLLAQHRKDVKQQVQQGKKDIEISDLTIDIIEKTTQITVLKVWAKKLGVPGLLEYKVANISGLKRAMIEKLSGAKEIIEPVINVVIEDDKDLFKQYTSIEKFLKSYIKNPNKTTSIYGSAGDEFNGMWKDLTRNEKTIFAQEYFELNIDAKNPITGARITRVNPVAYLKGFAESRKDSNTETPESVTASYLRLFIKGTDTPERAAQLQTISEHPLFPKTFLTKFEKLEQSVAIKFAGMYIRSGGYRNPIDALEMFVTPEVKKEVLPMTQMFIGGLQGYSDTEVKNAEKNDYNKCVTTLEKFKWIIKPISNVDEVYLGDQVEIGDLSWYHPSKAFYTDLCQYHSYVLSPTDSVIVLNSNKRATVHVRHDTGAEYNPTELSKELIGAQTGNIFLKLSPLWILNTPLYQIDKVYLDSASSAIPLSMNLTKVISDLQKSSRYDTFQTYLIRFIIMFFPLIRNTMIPVDQKPYTKEGSTLKPHIFLVAEHLHNGYITPECYGSMSITEKAPEVNIQLLIEFLNMYISVFSVEVIKNSGKSTRYFSSIQYTSEVFNSVNCPEQFEWNPKDLLIYENKCIAIPQLLTDFSNGNFTNPSTGAQFPKDFVDSILSRFSSLKDKKFQKIVTVFYDYVTLKNDTFGSDSIIVSQEPGEIVYIDKNAYDMAHPVITVTKPVKKDKYSSEDLSEQFNSYFKIQSVILDPIAVIANIMHFDPQAKCNRCNANIGKSAVKSILNRTDGTTIQVSFCGYKCMMDHDFIPMHTVEEVINVGTQVGDVIGEV
jgi:hypothetical protein